MCGCDWDIDRRSPLYPPTRRVRSILIGSGGGGVVVVAMINQLPAAGSKPVADTNKWQKWGRVLLANTLQACGCFVAWVGQAVGNTQMALRLVGWKGCGGVGGGEVAINNIRLFVFACFS